MKKLKVFAVVAVMAVISSSVFYACKKDGEENRSTLEKELTSLNNRIYSDIRHSNKAQKLSWGEIKEKASAAAKAWGKACSIAGPDIVGAAAGVAAAQKLAIPAGVASGGTLYIAVSAAGGLVASTGASYSAYQILESASPPSPISNLNVRGWDIQGYGAMHNELLWELFERNEGNELGNAIPILVELATSKDETGSLQQILSLNEWEEVMEQIMEISTDYGRNGGNLTQLLEDHYAKGFLTDNLYQVLNSFIEVYSTITDVSSLDIVVASYADFVRNSSFLSEDERLCMLVSLGVASKSPHFWIQCEGLSDEELNILYLSPIIISGTEKITTVKEAIDNIWRIREENSNNDPININQSVDSYIAQYVDDNRDIFYEIFIGDMERQYLERVITGEYRLFIQGTEFEKLRYLLLYNHTDEEPQKIYPVVFVE